MIEMEISSERVDDIPLIVEMLQQMEIAKWIGVNASKQDLFRSRATKIGD
jgi:hypothetical protein